MRIRFDTGPNAQEQPAWFNAPRQLISAWHACDVSGALAQIDAARAAGSWVAGYASYELGYALEPKLAELMPQRRKLPLLQFGVYDAPTIAAPLAGGVASLQDFKPLWDAKAYQSAFDTVKAAIGAGDIYQANLTYPIDAQAKGSAEALYGALIARQPVGHGALVVQDALPTLLSRSPELFFRTDADGVIETRPMKGTQPRSDDASEDLQRKEFLMTDEKSRAENLMIVDLLRNDISRVAELGSVQVPDLFAVETYTTVHQMVSLVRARLRVGVTLADIFAALFPCGSITGAPKVSAMTILANLEPAAREIYCGTIGWAAPDGRSEFNVAIRTLTLDGTQARFNVGGGLVWDSTAASEYEETQWKSRFAHLS